MNVQNLNSPPIITNHGVFDSNDGTPVNNMFTVGDTYSYGIMDTNSIMPYFHTCQKSAREQVQDEILAKIAEAIESNDLKKAKELVKLAKAVKEL